MATDLEFVEFIADQIDDSDWLSQVIRLTEAELPTPKKKKAKTTKR
jgi:hypothetical protein